METKELGKEVRLVSQVVRVSSEFEKLQVKASLALEGFGYCCIGMLVFYWIKGS